MSKIIVFLLLFFLFLPDNQPSLGSDRISILENNIAFLQAQEVLLRLELNHIHQQDIQDMKEIIRILINTIIQNQEPQRLAPPEPGKI